MSKPADPRTGFTARLAPPIRERDLAAREEAEGVVRTFVDPDLGGADRSDVAREDGEGEGRHARRAATLDRLFATGR